MSQNNFNPLDWANTQLAQPAHLSSPSPSGEGRGEASSDFETLVRAIESAGIDIAPTYDEYFKVGVALATEFGQSGRSYFHRICRFYPGYNATDTDRKYDDCLRDTNPSVTIATIYHLAKQAGIVLRPEHSRGNYAQSLPGPRDISPLRADTPKKEKKPRINKLVAIRSYLCEHYHNGADLRNDLLSRKIQIRKNEAWHDLTDKDICSITCAIAAATDTNITTADVHTVLCSDLVQDVHPLRDWLNNLPPYTPDEGKPSPIDSLAAQVKIKSFTKEDNPLLGRGQGEVLWHTCFRKWFVAMVASWLFDDIVNHQVLVLISEQQGIYKTTWLEHIIPPELRQYLTKLASARELSKDERLRTAEFGLINMDEIDSMSPRELNVLKSVITTADVNERAAYGRTKERRVRCASFCASGNNRKFLSDDTGNRRWLPFEVLSIDNPWGRIEPYADIYAEAVYLIQNGFEYWFTQDETRAMAAHTDEFRAQSNEEELLPIYFAPATRDSYDAKALTASEIHRELIDNGHILRPMPVNKFGALLQKMGFERRSLNGGGKGYYVRQFDLETVRQHQDEQTAAIRQQLTLADATCSTIDAESVADSRQQDTTLPF